MAGAATSHCYPEGVHPHCHTKLEHYLFTDSSRLICSIDGHAMIWRSSPLYSSWSKACSLWNTCWMLFCGKSHPITVCWREINTTFPFGLRCLTILFPCQLQNFVSFFLARSLIQLHLAPWWTVHRQHKDFSIKSSITAKDTISKPKFKQKAQPKTRIQTQDCSLSLYKTDWQALTEVTNPR